jgi:pantoate--beta-alanine ligase
MSDRQPVVVTDPDEMRRLSRRWWREGRSIGFVPTMGNLHEGHSSLMRRAAADADVAVASIYVNPLQFGPSEDFAAYPRTFADDLAGAAAAGVEVVFAPTDAVMYPPEFATHVDVEGLTEGLCGAARPGHFRGVTTVVMKLLCLVLPHVAYFGEKDYQQLVVIRRMVDDLGLGPKVVGMPIVREADGLAMSSRNRYLSPDEREAATALSRGLAAARAAAAGGEWRAAALEDEARAVIEREPLATVEYVSLVDPDSLVPMTALDGPGRLLVAARVGPARLIDNGAIAPG